MFKRLKRGVKLWRLWELEREIRALEKYGNRSDPQVQEMIQRAKQVVARGRAS
jgi:hypothetical protein